MSAIIQSFLDDSYSNRLSFMKLSWADNWCKRLGIEYGVKEKYLHLKYNNNTSILINESQKIQFGEAYSHISLINDEIVIAVADFMFGVAMTLSLYNGSIKIDGYQGNWQTPYGAVYAEQISNIAKSILKELL